MCPHLLGARMAGAGIGRHVAAAAASSSRGPLPLRSLSPACCTARPPGAPGTARSLIRASPPALGSRSLPGLAPASCGTCRRGRPPRPTARVRRGRRKGHECMRTRCSVVPSGTCPANCHQGAPCPTPCDNAHATTPMRPRRSPPLLLLHPPQAPTVPGSAATPPPPTPSTSSQLPPLRPTPLWRARLTQHRERARPSHLPLLLLRRWPMAVRATAGRFLGGGR